MTRPAAVYSWPGSFHGGKTGGCTHRRAQAEFAYGEFHLLNRRALLLGGAGFLLTGSGSNAQDIDYEAIGFFAGGALVAIVVVAMGTGYDPRLTAGEGVEVRNLGIHPLSWFQEQAAEMEGQELEPGVAVVFFARNEIGPWATVARRFGLFGDFVIRVRVPTEDEVAEEEEEVEEEAAPACFSGDTTVVLADGSVRPIGALNVGDDVLSFDFATGHTVSAPVTDLHTANAKRSLRVNGIRTTRHHPFAVGPDLWAEAGDLLPGDPLWCGQPVSAVEQVPGELPVYDLTVGGTHNFYVTSGIAPPALVHNKGIAVSCFAEQSTVALVHNKDGVVCFAEGSPAYLVHNKRAGFCFAEGTSVPRSLTHPVPIERVEPGDEVLAFDTRSRQWGPRAVTDIQEGVQRKDYIRINDSLMTSPNHLLAVDGRMVQASDVRVGTS